MEQNHIPTSSEAATYEPAFPRIPVPGTSDTAPAARRSRHDGWTPDRQVVFLEALAACGVVTDACARAGLSAQSAYAFRNRRSGRAFATAWDAVLVHRARARLSDEVFSRAMNGCLEQIRRDGEVTAERHRFDNRLSMAVLSRLDRLAEQQGHRQEQLRAVSEDLDDLLDCIEQGGDADAFVEARKPAPAAGAPESERLAQPEEPFVWTEDGDRRWTAFPPPAGFEGLEEGEYDGLSYYARTLTAAEEDAMDADLAALRLEEAAKRDRYFGFAGGSARSSGPDGAGRPADGVPDPGLRHQSTSSTYRDVGGERHG